MTLLTVQDRETGIAGKVEAIAISPDGKTMVRANDRWLLIDLPVRVENLN